MSLTENQRLQINTMVTGSRSILNSRSKYFEYHYFSLHKNTFQFRKSIVLLKLKSYACSLMLLNNRWCCCIYSYIAPIYSRKKQKTVNVRGQDVPITVIVLEDSSKERQLFQCDVMPVRFQPDLATSWWWQTWSPTSIEVRPACQLQTRSQLSLSTTNKITVEVRKNYIIYIKQGIRKGTSGHILRKKNTAVRPKFRPWKSRGPPVFQGYACNCNPRCTLTEIYPLFLVCKPSLELSSWKACG